MNFSRQKNLNPETIGFFQLILEDFKVHGYDPLSQGFWAISVHRTINQINSLKFNLILYPARIFSLCLMRVVEWFTGITLLPSTKIGRRVRIWHHSGIIINADSIGDDVVLRQNTTFGEKQGVPGRPKIGNMVDVGCGVVIIGDIAIGDNVVIGANSVVVKNVLPNAVIVGIPAKQIN